MTTTNQQVKLLMKKLKKSNQETAAAKAGMDVKTARKYMNSEQLPSEMKKTRQRTQPTTFSSHWGEISKMLEASPRLQAKTILGYLLKKYPDTYKADQLRTLQRHIQEWRSQYASHSLSFFVKILSQASRANRTSPA